MSVNKIVLNVEEKEMTLMIKEFLSLENNSNWSYSTIAGKFELKFNGNHYTVMEALLDWLNAPKRRQLIESKTRQRR